MRMTREQVVILRHTDLMWLQVVAMRHLAAFAPSPLNGASGAAFSPSGKITESFLHCVEHVAWPAQFILLQTVG